LPTVSAKWREAFGDVPPIGHVMRAKYGGRWLRIHSLPGAKRYATNTLESQVILVRHNEAASYLLGTAGTVALFVRFSDPRSAHELISRYHQLSLTQDPALDWVDPDEPEVTFGFLTAEFVWSASALDQLLLDVANDSVPSVTLYSPSTGFVYAPYDGGADIIVPRAADLPRLRIRWSEWMSPHAEGL
jgi:hypothetical protein